MGPGIPDSLAPMHESALTAQAAAGDRTAFEQLVEPLWRPLRSYIYRMVTHPEDADELLQASLLRAFERLRDFRGESSFKTWLFSIATRLCLDHLRTRRQWYPEAQLDAERFAKSHEAELAPIHGTLESPDFTFDFREHIAFCFSCVSRCLPPEQHAALLLREVFDFTNREAARLVGVSESVFRHSLAAARGEMEKSFEGLCALINKQGTCYQCNVLRDAAPEPNRGEPVQPLAPEAAPAAEKLDARLRVVREADLAHGRSHALHDVILRMMTRMVEEGLHTGGKR
jgi:RNA polymerase sigma-70 factor (ECF subfamily)